MKVKLHLLQFINVSLDKCVDAQVFPYSSLAIMHLNIGQGVQTATFLTSESWMLIFKQKTRGQCKKKRDSHQALLHIITPSLLC